VAPKLKSLPGVEAVALTTSVPPQGGGRRALEIEGAPAQPPDQRGREVVVVTVSPGFFEAVGINLTHGRDFHDTDGTPGSETAIINQRLASQFFPNENPIGRRMRFVAPSSQPGPPQVWRTIVGISPSIRHNSPEDLESAAAVYVPLRQEAPGGAAVLVRSALAPGTVMHAVGREVQAVDADQPLFAVQTIDEILSRQRWPFRVFGSLFAIFAVIALVLSSVGLYAVMAYSVTVRTSEIGVRMALGADAPAIQRMVLREGSRVIGLGLAGGLVAALAGSRLLQTLLFEVRPGDPVTVGIVCVMLGAVGLAACYLPARRATRVDPLAALRTD
jgi:predicted permease